MPSLLELCEKFFGTKNLYTLFDIPKKSKEKEVKKAYYKLSLKVHPDRVLESEKEEATEKFKLLSKLYNVLIDDGKRSLYDEKGIIDDDEESSALSDFLNLFRQLFKPISEEDLDNYEKSYKGSELEKSDVKKSYLQGKGCIDYMMECVPFFDVEDEPRIAKIIGEMIKDGEVPEYKAFTNEPLNKKTKRHKKYAREARMARMEIKKKKDSLASQIQNNQLERANKAESFFQKLLDKYGDEDDDDELYIDNSVKKPKTSGTTTKNVKKLKNPTKDNLHKVRDGKVDTRSRRSK